MLALIAAEAHANDGELASLRVAFGHTVAEVLGQVTAEAHQWLFPPDQHPGMRRLLGELTRYEVRAITGQQTNPRQ